jgi:hypothetical protein
MIPKEFEGMTITVVAHGDGLIFANAYDLSGAWRGAWRVSREEARNLRRSK